MKEKKAARPLPTYRAKIAFGNYRKGALLQPMGLYRDVLLTRGVIELVRETPPAPVSVVVTMPDLPVAREQTTTREIRRYHNRGK